MDTLQRFTVAEVAAQTGLHPRSIYAAISAGRLKVGRISTKPPKGKRPAHVRYGGIRISADQLQAWLDR